MTTYSLTPSVSLKYSTPLILGQALGIVKDVPSTDVSGTPTNETVGVGDNANLTFYLDQKRVVSDTYTIFNAGTAMTETTEYTIDKDTGTITLTTTGLSNLGTATMTAKYSYFDNDMKDSFIAQTLNRAEQELDKILNTSFTDGTQNNPTYPSVTEIQTTEGRFMDRFIVNKKPLRDIIATISGAFNDSDTTITLQSAAEANKFPTSGTVIIDSEVMTYTGTSGATLTGVTRASLGTTAATHDDNAEVHSTIFFISSTVEGTSVVFTVQPWHTSMYANEDGLIYRYKDVDPTVVSRLGVAERVKIIYLHGGDTIPSDITRLTIILAKRALMADNISKSMISGRDEFQPEMFNVDRLEMERIINSYIVLSMGNT